MLSIPVQNLDWMDTALCKEIPAELFFPETTSQVNAKEAKRVCSLCAVRPECLEYALNIPGVVGVFGGTTEHERRRLKRKMNRD